MSAWNAVKPAAPPTIETFPIDVALRKLAPVLARAACETASAFLNAPASLAPGWAAPRTGGPQHMLCSQKNLGERFDMICNLSADAQGWARLFPGGTDASIRADAYCELVNCMCGGLIADPDFADWFGYLIPCVPCSGPGCLDEGSHSVKGALRLKDTWIRFCFSVGEAAGTRRQDVRLIAAA